MDKKIIKLLLIITITVCYFVNLLVMFECSPLNLLIVNIGVWLLIIAIILCLKFVDWLND